MVRAVQRDNIAPVGIGSGQAEGQFIGLTAGADKKTDAQRVWKSTQQSLSIFNYVVVQVTRVGVEHRHLTLPGSHHVRMTVAHMAYIVDAIHIYLAVITEQVLSLALYNLQGIVIGNGQVAPDMRFSYLQNVLFGSPHGIEAGLGNAQDDVRIRAKAFPHLVLARPSHTGKISTLLQ